MLGEIYRWISRAGLLCLAVGGFVPLAAPPKKRPTSGRRRTEGHGNKAVNEGEDRERVRGEKVGGRNGRLGSGEGRYSSERSTQLAARGPSGNRRPFAKIYTRRGTKNMPKRACEYNK